LVAGLSFISICVRTFSQPTSAGAAYSENVKLGIISDTHGLLRPEVLSALRGPAFSGIDRILHCGDVGKISILDELAKIAPVTAIRGNVDREGACAKLPETDVVLIDNPPHAGLYIYMLHDLKSLHLDPAAAKFAAVLHGHTHVPNFVTKKGVLYFNPGSCGPRRFELPVTIGILTIASDGKLKPQIVHLAV
jgi:putative phosphoesterase